MRWGRDLFFLGLGLLLGLIAGLTFYPYRAGATYKPEYAGHSERLRDWFRNAELTEEARKRMQVGWKSCCESSERVRPQYHISKTDNGDEWSYLCDGSKDLEAACRNVPAGGWKVIPHDIVHQEEITLKNPDNNPQVADEQRQLRAEGVLFILKDGSESCFWPPESGQ